jgi:hypothetical protein
MQQWRQFCNQFEEQVEEWNMATLLRINADGDISEENIVLGVYMCSWNSPLNFVFSSFFEIVGFHIGEVCSSLPVLRVSVPRIQFLAIEIARNREGFNESIRKT